MNRQTAIVCLALLAPGLASAQAFITPVARIPTADGS